MEALICLQQSVDTHMSHAMLLSFLLSLHKPWLFELEEKLFIDLGQVRLTLEVHEFLRSFSLPLGSSVFPAWNQICVFCNPQMVQDLFKNVMVEE